MGQANELDDPTDRLPHPAGPFASKPAAGWGGKHAGFRNRISEFSFPKVKAKLTSKLPRIRNDVRSSTPSAAYDKKETAP